MDIAIQDDFLAKGKKGRLDHAALAQFITCYVQKFYKLKSTYKHSDSIRLMIRVQTSALVISKRIELFFKK